MAAGVTPVLHVVSKTGSSSKQQQHNDDNPTKEEREKKKNPAKIFLDVYNLPPKPTGAANVKSTGVFESFFLLLLRPFKKKKRWMRC
jgi:hypothetical protein